MKSRWSLAAFLVILLLTITACEKAWKDPTPTPDESNIQAASTLFAQPTRSPRSTETPTPASDVEFDLSRSVARMEQAVLAGDMDAYMAYVWKGDPVFLADHTQWAQDWKEHPLSVFQIDLYNIHSDSPDVAIARMSTLWGQQDCSGDGTAGGATVSADFRREGDTWQLAGESWRTIDTEGIRFYYFSNDIIDNQPQAEVVAEYLPGVYTGLTLEFGFVPEHVAHIKMFESPITLQNWTRLSMPGITRWNEPGESIKITLSPNNTAPHEPTIANEYTRFILYEMADGTHGNFNWWLEEGIAEYGASRFRPLSQRNRILKQVAAWSTASENEDEHLIAWGLLETKPNLPPDQMQIAVDQAYTVVQYVTEQYGTDNRNTWIRAIATTQTVEQATQAELGLSLDNLLANWQAWLLEQL